MDGFDLEPNEMTEFDNDDFDPVTEFDDEDFDTVTEFDDEDFDESVVFEDVTESTGTGVLEELEETVEEAEETGGTEAGIMIASSAPASASPAEPAFPRNAQTADENYNQAVARAFSSSKGARDEFLATERTFGLIRLSEPREVTAVKNAINQLDDLLKASVPELDADYAFQVASICLAYEGLLQSCRNYAGMFASIKRPSRTERSWLELAHEIEGDSEDELGKFNLIKGAYIQGTRIPGDKWTDVLFSLRSTDVNSLRFLEEVGEGTSKVYRVKGANDVESFIKYEDRIANSLSDVSSDEKKAKEFKVATEFAQIDAGSTVSDRNASSTRVAKRLGLGDTVARSETVLLSRDRLRVQRANVMESVRGDNIMTMAKLSDSVRIASERSDLYGKEIVFSGRAARQMFELQIFDLITGQVDRHFKNIMARFDISGSQVVITGIKAIDNDMSFGKVGADRPVSWLRPISDTDISGSLKRTSIPYISRDLYDKLMMPGIDLIFRYDQLDLRSDAEIKALIDRFIYVREEIRDLHKRGLLEILDDEREFAERYEERMRTLRANDQLSPSYMSRFMGGLFPGE